MNRRGFLGAILAAGVAPAVVKAANIMPVFVRREVGGLLVPGERYFTATDVARQIKDYQRMYNYWMSQVVEQVALAPKGPWLT